MATESNYLQGQLLTVGTPGETSQGNRQLVAHGIQNDESDFRIHIGFAHGKAYLFPTGAGRRVLQNGKAYKEFQASQPGVKIVTGVGYKVPWVDVENCQEIDIPQDLLETVQCKRTDLPQDKGRKALAVARGLLKRGLIPLPLLSREIDDKDSQIKGKDLIVTSQSSIQVKCDFWCAQYGLSMQTAECNPLRRY